MRIWVFIIVFMQLFFMFEIFHNKIVGKIAQVGKWKVRQLERI